MRIIHRNINAKYIPFLYQGGQLKMNSVLINVGNK